MKLPIYLLGQLGLKLEQKNELSMMEWVWSYTRAKGRVVDGKGVELEEESSITCFEAEETSSGSEERSGLKKRNDQNNPITEMRKTIKSQKSQPSHY